MNQDSESLRSLLSAGAVREQCHRVGKLAKAGKTQWFSIDESKFDRCVDYVADTCRHNYPDLNIPLHSRWRHFEIADSNLWQHHTGNFDGDPLDLARSAIDLVFISVLLDAGAGGQWCFRDPVSGSELTRSEGLAAASVSLFFDKLAHFDADKGWHICAEDLFRLDQASLAETFQHSTDNPLLGVEGRLELLHGLARVLQANSAENSFYSRPGGLIDECLELSRTGNKKVDIAEVLKIILMRFGKMWPSGYQYHNVNLGDCGYHSLLASDDPLSGIVPFHKLSQWLTYSLVEPLQWAGYNVVNLDSMTGLPEYRNGGLFLDMEVFQAQDERILDERLSLESESVVEWRALTVYQLDQLAQSLRIKLGLDAEQLPLGSVLQGGSWAAGRRIATQKRSDASPPLNLAIDGTIF